MYNVRMRTLKHTSKRPRRSFIQKTHQSGGSILKSNEFSKIISIGYEFECGDVMVTHKKGQKFMIPDASKIPDFLHDENKKTIGDYRVLFSTETDSPMSGQTETHSKIYHFEQRHLKEANNILAQPSSSSSRPSPSPPSKPASSPSTPSSPSSLSSPSSAYDLLRKAGFDMKSRSLNNVFLRHLELLFTFSNKEDAKRSLNDENCIVNTMKTMIDILHGFFIPANESEDYDGGVISIQPHNEYEHGGMRLSFFKPNQQWISKPIYYVVPSSSSSNSNAQAALNLFEDTLWVPQMTYCVKVEDILAVTGNLASFLTRDDYDHVMKSMRIVDVLMSPTYERKATDESKRSPVYAQVREKVKNVLFFAVYYFYVYYFFESVDEIEIRSVKNPRLYKNLFCFTLRHSIDEILHHYMQTNPDEMKELKLCLTQNIRDDDDNFLVDRSFATSLLISYVSRSFIRICEPDYVYEKEGHQYGSSDISARNCTRSIDNAPFEKYLFSKLFKCESNYFEFVGDVGTVLIEYRCFHKNLIQTHNKKFPKKAKSLVIHKSLKEWKEIIDDLKTLRK